MDNIKKQYDDYSDGTDYYDSESESNENGDSVDDFQYNYDTMFNNSSCSNNTIMCKNMDPSLKKILGIIDEYESQEKIDWVAPSKSGLENSEPIIPKYFTKYKNTELPELITINYYQIIKDDIRNYRKLNTYQIEYIKKLEHEKKNELFDIYNRCISSLIDVMNEKP